MNLTDLFNPIQIPQISELSGLSQSLIWGETPVAPWVQTTLTPGRDLMSRNTQFHLQVSVQPHTICILGDREVKRPGREPLEVETNLIPDIAVKDLASKVFVEAIYESVRSLAPLLREDDPRIGTIVIPGEAKLPSCPLFDPPRFRIPKWEGASGLDTVPCPICGHDFNPGSQTAPAMWGGGNLQWVHPDCWYRLHVP